MLTRLRYLVPNGFTALSLLLKELLAYRPGALEELLAVELTYPHVNGIPRLRETIAGLYEGASPDNVLVTRVAPGLAWASSRSRRRSRSSPWGGDPSWSGSSSGWWRRS